VRADALIVDANFQGGAAVAEASGLPWCSPRGAGLPTPALRMLVGA
jgi:hypothetical protein